MTRPATHPHVYWVKVREVPGAPTHFELDGAGLMWGYWLPDDYAGRFLADATLRFWGFEKCFCDPTDTQPDPQCRVHCGQPVYPSGV